MNCVVNKTVGSGKAVFALLVTVTLAVQGARAGELSGSTKESAPHHNEASPGLVVPVPTLPSHQFTKNELAPDGKPVGGQHTYLVLPLILKTDNTEDRLKTKNNPCRETNHSSTYQQERFSVLTSTSLISSHLGRRLTLVGAKPSGTS